MPANTATVRMPIRSEVLPPNGQHAPLPDILDFLTSQRRILREAPDAETALRWQLEGALAHIATQEAMLSTLQAQLWEVAQPPLRPHRPTLRPAIRTLLQTRAAPMTASQIQHALDLDEAMGTRLNDMVRDGQLTCTDGHYALVPGSGSLVPGSKPETRNQRPETIPQSPAAFTVPPDPTAPPPVRAKGRTVRPA